MKIVLHQFASFAYGVSRSAGNRARAGLLGLTALCALSVAPATADTVRLVALGDSLTQGYGLADGEGFVPVLQDWLTQQGADVTVINAGVSGDTTAGGLARMDWTLAEPADAMIVALGGNDLLRGLSPKTSRENLDGILARLKLERIPALLVGLPAPGNYGPEFKNAFEAMYVDLAAKYDVPLYPDFLRPLSEKADAGMSFRDLMQDDNIHPNATGVQEIVDAMGPEVLQLVQSVAEAEG
ncbi:arylesterase [Roseibaca sp. V10]|uniref:Arylesterase n=1 Tax=Roseinatronobacter domitianus TaxID=2940293 RepID=A0ABT0LZS2_9RHOB|nr:arylesterase [Roseibaca domitiana]MCL1628107.1 arylesterase [Roseibaca domitiana]